MAAKKDAVKEALYNVVRSPLVTEKSTRGSEHNQVTFKVDKSSTKPEIKAAVEGIFGVKVKSVNTLILKGKSKVFRGIRGRRSDLKKAIVTLEEGQTIDMTSQV